MDYEPKTMLFLVRESTGSKLVLMYDRFLTDWRIETIVEILYKEWELDHVTKGYANAS